MGDVDSIFVCKWLAFFGATWPFLGFESERGRPVRYSMDYDEGWHMGILAGK